MPTESELLKNLYIASRDFYNRTIADPTVQVTAPSAAKRDEIDGSGNKLRAAILAAKKVYGGE